MKHIIIAVTNDLTYDQRIHRICTSLSQHGYTISVIGRCLKNSVSLDHRSWEQKRIKCLFNKKFLFYGEFNIRLFFYLLFVKTNIFCAVDFDTLPSLTLLAKMRSKSLVFDAHEYFTEVPELENRQFVKGFWKMIGKICIPHANAAYTVSDSIAEILKNEFGQTFSVIRNIPPLDKINKGSTDEARYILYQGAINKGRGLEKLVEAMQFIDMKLIIAGDGDIRHEISQLVSEKNLTEKIEITGYILPDKLKHLTERAFIGYNLLDSTSKSYYYSLSNKFFTYIHAQIPSLSNNFPEYRKIIETYEVGMLIELETESIVQAVKLLTTNVNYYKNLKDNCRKASMHLNWQNEEKKLIEIYDQLG